MNSSATKRQRRVVGILSGAVASLTLLLFAGSAHADLLQPGAFSVTSTSSQAGAHPDLTTSFQFVADSSGTTSENVKDVVLDLPPGLIGEPAAIPQCPLPTFTAGVPFGSPVSCQVASQVGTVSTTYTIPEAPPNPPQQVTVQAPVYNLVPDPGETARLGFDVFPFGFQVIVSIRPNDYGVRTIVHNISAIADVDDISFTLWGVPADPAHDAQRGQQCFFGFCFGGGQAAGTDRVPFLTNPTSCGSALAATLYADSWQNEAGWSGDNGPDLSDPNWQQESAGIPAITGCNRLTFSPTISAQPSVSTPDAPSGYAVELRVPQNQNPDGLATAELRQAVVTLPAGVVLSPSAADGLADCTDAQVGLGESSPPGCPNGSQIGTATLTTPALPDQMTGDIYLAGPDSGPITRPPYGIFLTLTGDGVMVKLKGTVTPDPSTGQLTTTFTDTPQLPFSDLKLAFKDGPRAPLVTPSSCGTFTTTSDLEPWSAPDSGPDATPTDSFTISGCGNPNTFAPTFTAGATNAQAGAYSPFTLTFSRSDADQIFSALTTTLPPGLVAKLAGVPLCSDSDANAGTCPAGSQVGTVEAASGAGSHPFWLPGNAYLTGPYKGAPYGLTVEIPAIAGPFNLGVVVVRDAIHINPTTAQVSVTSDPFPTIIGGIPIQLRTVNVDLNRPDFMVNPTSCDVMAVTGTLSSTLGISAPVSSRFQVGGCAALKFSPKLRMKLTGNGSTHSGDHPTLVATVTEKRGQANIHNVRVALPLSLALDPNNSQHVCSYAIAQAVTTGPANCPASTLVGHATAVTPLLSKPLTGPVYLVQGIRMQNGVQVHTLPSLLIPLRGQIALDLRAQTSVSGGKLVSTFATIPDAAVSKFTLQINGGHNGILVITGRGRSICGSSQVTHATLAGQNGKAVYPNIKMGTPCRVSHHNTKHHRKHK